MQYWSNIMFQSVSMNAEQIRFLMYCSFCIMAPCVIFPFCIKITLH